jgi:hypothetical protein
MILGNGEEIPMPASTIRTYPNPFTDHLTLMIHQETDSRFSATVWTVRGEKAWTSGTLTAKKGENRFDLAIPGNLSRGLYLLQLTEQSTGKSVYSAKIQKR